MSKWVGIKYMQATILSLSKVVQFFLAVMVRKNMHLLRLIQWFWHRLSFARRNISYFFKKLLSWLYIPYLGLQNQHKRYLEGSLSVPHFNDLLIWKVKNRVINIYYIIYTFADSMCCCCWRVDFLFKIWSNSIFNIENMQNMCKFIIY